MWRFEREAKVTSFCRVLTSSIVTGSAPCALHKSTMKHKVSPCGSSLSTDSSGVFEYRPPSQYRSPSMRTGGNAGGRLPLARTWSAPSSPLRLSKCTSSPLHTLIALTVRRIPPGLLR